MKKTLIVAALFAVATSGAGMAHELVTAGVAQAHAHPQYRAHAHSGPVITQSIRVNCFRGPWQETIWDHPRAVFIDDLVAFGYDYADASAIAYRVCRDVTSVGNKSAITNALMAAIAQTPPPVGHTH